MKKVSILLIAFVLLACGLVPQETVIPTQVDTSVSPTKGEDVNQPTLSPDSSSTTNVTATRTEQSTVTPIPPSLTPTLSPSQTATRVIPSKTLTPTPEVNPTPSLDISDPESIIYWLASDMANGTTDTFRKIISRDTLLYGTGFAGGRDTISTQKFLADLEQRINSKPLCVGYTVSDASIKIWSKNWQPSWTFRGGQKSEELVFTFFLSDGDIDTWAYFTPSSDILEIIDHQPCPVIGASPTQINTKQYAIISDQIMEVNLRATPGYLGKNDNVDVLVKIPSGERVEIISGPKEKDGLSWWKITWEGYTGWIADHTASGREIIDFNP